MSDDLRANEWIQTRRRFDWMLGLLCLLVAIVATIAYQVNNQWTVFASVFLACGIWFWFRRTIPANGRPYSRARIRHDHAFMILIGAIAFPTFLAIYAVDWLGLPHVMWIYSGIFVIFLVSVLGGGGWLDRRFRRSIETSQLSSDSNAQDRLSVD
jgi:hypothetical protein